MKLSLVILIVIFIAIVYIYTLIRWRKNKKSLTESKIGFINKSNRITSKDDDPEEDGINRDGPIDFISREDLVKEVQNEVHKNDRSLVNPRIKELKF